MALTVAKLPVIVAPNNSIPVVSNEYCPNYPFTIGADAVLTFTGYDVRNLFYVGRSITVKTNGPNGDYDAVITYSDLLSGGTGIAADPAFTADTNFSATSDVCLKSSATNWSPIASDPFGGTSINAIAIGVVLGTTYAVASGTGGKLFISDDSSSQLGTSWVAHASSGSIDDINKIEYEEGNQVFIFSDANKIYKSFDALTTIVTAYDGSNVNIIVSDLWTVYSNSILIRSPTNDNYYQLSITGTLGSEVLVTTTGSRSKAGTKLLIDKKYNVIHELSSRYYYSDRLDVRELTSLADLGYAANNPGYEFPSNSVAINLDGDLLQNSVVLFNTGVTFVKTGSDVEGFTTRVYHTGVFNGLAYSATHIRFVIVGDSGIIRESSDGGITWSTVANGFDPLSNINAIAWDSNNGLFIAVANNGQICRSTNGIS